MEGVLCEYGQLVDLRPELGALVAELRQEVAELRAEVPRLRAEVGLLQRENLELRQQVGYWKGMHAQALRRLEALHQEVEHLRGENKQLQAQLFGQKSEKQSPEDRSNRLEGEDEPSPKK